MLKRIHRVTAVVRRVEDLAEGVRAFELADPDDWELPPFSAGSHIDVHLPSGAVRQYSLYGDPAEATRYRIAVRHEEQGRGGSRELHRTIAADAILSVSLPRNHFPLAEAPHHLMIAGGIGITPFIAMIEVLRRNGGSFELHYCSRTPETMPFRQKMAPLAARGLVHHYYGRAFGGPRLNIAQLVGRADKETHIYCCGPAPLIGAVRFAGGEAMESRLHFESFGAPIAPETAYEVELARSARVVAVPAGETMLNALREAGIDIPSSCEAGVCLECKTRVLAGMPVHRDLLMQPSDRLHYVTPCVSGCAGGRLVLDL